MSIQAIDFIDALKSAPVGEDFFQAFVMSILPFGVTDITYWANGPMKFIRKIQPKDLLVTRYSQDMLRQLGGMSGFVDDLTGAEFQKHFPALSKIILPIVHAMHCHSTKAQLHAYYSLSQHEKEVLSWLATGLRPDKIAHKLAVGYRTIDKYIVSAKTKPDANSRDHAPALSLGLLDI